MKSFLLPILLLLPVSIAVGSHHDTGKGTPIKRLPFNITEEGYYYFPSDLTVQSYCSISGPLLNIQSGGVTVDGLQHTLTTNLAGTANDEFIVISIPGSTTEGYTYSNIVIKNLTVKTDLTITSDTSVTNFIVGAQVNGAQDLILESLNFVNVTTGLRLNNADTVVVKKSLYEDNSANVNDYPAGRSIDIVQGVTNLAILENTFRQNDPDETIRVSGGIRAIFDTPAFPLRNIVVKESHFDGHDATISFRSGDNIVIEDVEIHQNNITLHAIEFGYEAPGDIVNNAVIRNTSITSLNNPKFNGYFGIDLNQGSGALIENVILVTNAQTAPPPNFEPAPAIRVGLRNFVDDPTYVFNNVLIDKVVISGPNSIGILIDGSSNVTIQNSLISEANVNIQTFAGAHNIEISNNEINGPATLKGRSVGISLEGTSLTNIYNNTLSGNRRVGIVVDAASTDNLILNNRLIDNGPPQINNQSSSTVVIGNVTVP